MHISVYARISNFVHTPVLHYLHLQYTWVNYRNAYTQIQLFTLGVFVCVCYIRMYVQELFEWSVLWIRNAILWNSIQLDVQSHGRGSECNRRNFIWLVWTLPTSIFMNDLKNIGFWINSSGTIMTVISLASPSIEHISNSIFHILSHLTSTSTPFQFTCIRFNSINT